MPAARLRAPAGVGCARRAAPSPPLPGAARGHNPRRPLAPAPALAPPPAAPAGEAAQEDTASTLPRQQPSFDWARHWYPVAWIEHLDAARPTAIDLLGVKLVIWKDPVSESWAAAEDACPHRLAPLSQGRVLATGLQCSLHGWEFDQGGACTLIPQAVGSPAAAASPRACLKTRPARVAQGMLWLFGCADAKAAEHVEPLLAPGFDPGDHTRAVDGTPLVFMGGRLTRDLPTSWATIADNGVDASHVDYAHTGVLGDMRGKDAGRVDAAMVDVAGGQPFMAAASARALAAAAATADAFVADVTSASPSRFGDVGRAAQRIAFEPPCLVGWYTDHPVDIAKGAAWRAMPMVGGGRGGGGWLGGGRPRARGVSRAR